MWTYVFLITVAIAAVGFEISLSFKDQDDIDIRIIVKEILEKEHRNQDILTEMTDLKATIHKQGKSMTAMQNQITSLKDVVIGHAQKLKDMDKVVNELKSAIKELKQSAAAMENTALETTDNETERQIHDKKEERNVFKLKENTTSLANDIRPTDYTTGRLKVFEKDHDQGKARNQQLKISKRAVSIGGVAFSAYLGQSIFQIGAGHTIKCDKILLNDGNSYNPFTGVFTVPKTGVYLLTFSTAAYNAGDITDVKLVVNNRNIVDARASIIDKGHHVMGGNTAIVRLTQGESIWLEIYDHGNVELISEDTYRWTTFSGVFLFS